MIKAIVDIGEIGWSMYHRGHLWWRYEHGETPPQVQVWTLPDRFRLYEPFICAELKELPKKCQGNKRRNCFTYSGFNQKFIYKMFGISRSSLIHGCVADKKPEAFYRDRITIKKFTVTSEELNIYNKKILSLNKNKKNIIVVPRYKEEVGRNWSKDKWERLLKLLYGLGCNIILCGLTCQSYDIKIDSRYGINLISNNPFVDTLCSLDNPKTVLCVASQGFSGKLALLQNVNTVMWGHQKKRHQVGENWSTNPKTVCDFIDDKFYNINPQVIFNHVKKMI